MKSWDVTGQLSYSEAAVLEGEDHDSDVFVLRKKRIVSVTPISLDLTSRVELTELEKQSESRGSIPPIRIQKTGRHGPSFCIYESVD